MEGMYVDEAMNGMSFRNYGDLLHVLDEFDVVVKNTMC